MRTVLRALAGLSLLAVLAAGVVVSQWVLPVEVSRTVGEDFGSGMENLEIDVGRGVHLHVMVTDSGPGGASLAKGTGLVGIADRLSGVDGKLWLSSPAGGPTVVTMEVPCAS